MKSAFLVTSALVLAALNGIVIQKEQFIQSHDSLYLELAPADPRSLMQGDYMALNYSVSNEARSNAWNKETENGYFVVALDDRRVGRFRRIDAGQPLANNEQRIRYRVRNWRVRIGAESFFFQEGHGPAYAKAKYGELKVSPDGECLLVGLRDADLKPIKPE